MTALSLEVSGKSLSFSAIGIVRHLQDVSGTPKDERDTSSLGATLADLWPKRLPLISFNSSNPLGFAAAQLVASLAAGNVVTLAALEENVSDVQNLVTDQLPSYVDKTSEFITLRTFH